MTLPTEVQLKMLSREELIAVVTELLATVKLLQARVTKLEAGLAKLRQPPATSRNSSAPPSRDWKADLPGRRRKKRGPPFGPERAVREWVDDPDQVIEAPVTRCSRCQADLSGVVPRTIVRRQLTESPEIRSLVTPRTWRAARRAGSGARVWAALGSDSGLPQARTTFELRAHGCRPGRSVWCRDQ